MKKSLILFLFAVSSARCYSQEVNQFTGALMYDVPLLDVPSDRGNAVTIRASYAAGIQMKQSASEIGLGWNLDAGGAIYRSVNGFPDDVRNYNRVSFTTGLPVVGQGALYPEILPVTYPFVAPTDYDFYTYKKGLDTSEFTFPAYDKFSVVGPGVSGQMKLSYLKFYSYDTYYDAQNYISTLVPNTNNLSANGFPGSAYYRRPQFHFDQDFSDTLVSRHYPSPINVNTPFKEPTDLISGLGYASSFEPYIGKHISGVNITNENFDEPTGRLATKKIVEYFTNAEINAAASIGFSSGALMDFIDFEPGHYRGSPYPEEGIGYFRITTEKGLTYHYSLPVYETAQTQYQVPLNNDYSLPGTIDLNDFDANPQNYYKNSTKIVLKSASTNRYAVKWLLTAVTGPDYYDTNNNHMADDGDAGYWVNYDYRLWDSQYTTRSPQYGYSHVYMPDAQTQDYPLYFPTGPVGPCPENLNSYNYDNLYKLTGWYGVVSTSKSEVYHLNRMRTSSHTAVFVRDIRQDEKGGHEEKVTPASFKPDPDLMLKRILLFANSDFDGYVNSNTGFNTNNFTNPTPFEFGTINTAAGLFSEGWYQSYRTGWQGTILRNVEFDQDYSLCKNYYGNINVDCASSTVLMSPDDVRANVSALQYDGSGKLTLNRILMFEYGNIKVKPSILYEYPTGTHGNPDYADNKVDYWGYYKADATPKNHSGYTNLWSKAYTNAWSLKKITSPMGGITELHYESNSYNKVLDNDGVNGVRGPAFIYRIKDINYFPQNYRVTMEEGETAAPLNEFVALCNSGLSGLQKRIFLPYYSAICYAPSCITWFYNYNPHGGFAYKGFYGGDCSTAITVGQNGSTNSVSGSITPTLNSIASNIIDGTRYYDININPNQGNGGPAATAEDYYYSGAAYSGNGFIMFETPPSYEAYGGGIRVKQINSTNSAYETYVQLYTYEGGVATNEMDRFDYQTLKRHVGASTRGQWYNNMSNQMPSTLRYTYLQPKSFDPLESSPYIGYSKVTVQNYGQASTPNGRSETTYATDPNLEPAAFRPNRSVSTVFSVQTVGVDPYLYSIYEYNTIFSNYFGSTKETKVYDKNNNMLSKTVFEYESPDQGAVVENFHYSNTNYDEANGYTGPIYSYSVNILRDRPVVVKSISTYGTGNCYEKREMLRRDEITGITSTMRVTGKNKSTLTTFEKPAYKFYQVNAGQTFTSTSFRRMVPLDAAMYSYSNIDSTLASSPASFAKADYKLYSNYAMQTIYSGNGFYTRTSITLPYYMHNRSFNFDAGTGSMNDYGLFNKSDLTSNMLNLTSASTDFYWEPTSTFNWKMNYEVTLVDYSKRVVETRDKNNRYNASRYGYGGKYRTSAISNSNYASYTFANFESFGTNTGTVDYESSLHVMNNAIIYGSAHTGLKHVEVTSAKPISFKSFTHPSPLQSTELGLQAGKIYRASVWVHTTNQADAMMQVTVNGFIGAQAHNTVYTAIPATHLVTTIGNWSLLQIDAVVPDGFSTGGSGMFKVELKTTTGNPVYYDDLIVRPVEGEFTGNVYDARSGRVVSSLDGNGFTTNYVYDAGGKVTEEWKEIPSIGYKRVKRYSYNYARGANN